MKAVKIVRLRNTKLYGYDTVLKESFQFVVCS
jgi:hypothetical protein